MRHTRSHTANRRSHHALKAMQTVPCKNCGTLHLMHRVCMHCGMYRGRQVIDVLARKTKKAMHKAEAQKAKKGTEKPAPEKESKSS